MKTEDFIEIEKMLNTIIRYLLAGGAAVLAFGVVRPSHFHFLCVDSQQKEISATLTMLFVLVSGAATYLLHRALFFPLIYWCLIRILKSKKSGLAQSRTHNEIVNALTTTRNTRRRGAIPMQSHFDTWAAEVHALYGICLGSLFAIAAAWQQRGFHKCICACAA